MQEGLWNLSFFVDKDSILIKVWIFKSYMDNEMINPWAQVKSYHGHFEISQTVKEAYLDQVSEEKLQENLAIVPKELFHEDQGVQKNPSKLQTTDSFLDIFQDDLRIRIYENTDEQLLFRVLRNLKNAE